MENLVSIKQAAELLAVSVNTIRGWTKEKNLPYYRTGRHFKFLPSELLEWAKGQAEEYRKARDRKLRPQRGPKPRVRVMFP